MTSDQVFIGLGLTLVLAVGSQLVAGRLRIPALIILLPVGFLAGVLVPAVEPERLFGVAFEPMVSLAVAVILYEAGLSLDLRRLKGHIRGVVIRLIAYGVPVTFAATAAGAALLLGMSTPAALMAGAILVVSGPTVVGPLLKSVRPTERVQRILIWEGSLIDPIGAILGTVVFSAIVASNNAALKVADATAQFITGLLIGLLGGAVGTGILWLLLAKLDLGEVLGTSVQLAAVIGVAAASNAIRDDTGLTAAIVMGLAVANLRGFDLPARRPFLETAVNLIIGVLFISISATITQGTLRNLALATFALVAVLVLIVRPLVAVLASLGTDLTRGERIFAGWMAPRGIVAAATASTFSSTLVAQGVPGAQKILPVTFLVIVFTVTLYGLTAGPVARRLGVTRPARTRPLLIGGDPWVLDLAGALQSTGLQVVMWAGIDAQRDRISEAGLELAPGELVAAATGRGAELEGVNTVLLLTTEHDFNSLAAMMLHDGVDGPVYRVGPPQPSHGVVAPYMGGDVLFTPDLSGARIADRYATGSRFIAHYADGALPAEHDLLFVVGPDGRLDPVTEHHRPPVGPGGTLILLTPVAQFSRSPMDHQPPTAQ